MLILCGQSTRKQDEYKCRQSEAESDSSQRDWKTQEQIKRQSQTENVAESIVQSADATLSSSACSVMEAGEMCLSKKKTITKIWFYLII